MCVFPTSPHLLHPSKWFPLCCSAHISKPSKWFPQCPHLEASVPKPFHVWACPVPCVCPSKWSLCSLLCNYANISKPLFPNLFICVSVLLLPCEPPDNNLSSGSQSSERETGQNNTTKSQGDYLERWNLTFKEVYFNLLTVSRDKSFKWLPIK